jgi:hypothetical protein
MPFPVGSRVLIRLSRCARIDLTLYSGGPLNKPVSPTPGSDAQSITERLARETNTPVEKVAEIYATESAELERTARVKTFVGVLTTRRVRRILNERSGGSA